MSLKSIPARNASLAMSYGADKGSLAPTSLEVALFVGDPDTVGVELAGDGGYSRAVVDNDGTTWPDAPDDGAITSMVISFGTSTDAWSGDADCFQIYDADTGDAWDNGKLAETISVDGADTPVAVQLIVFYSNADA